MYSFGEQTEGLPQEGNGGGQIDARTRGLTFGFGRFQFDAQARRQIGFAEAERLLEKATGFTRQLRALVGGRELLPGGLDPYMCGIQIGDQAFAFES